jgi:hypothetical protein
MSSNGTTISSLVSVISSVLGAIDSMGIDASQSLISSVGIDASILSMRVI